MKATLWALTLLLAGAFAHAATDATPRPSLAPELNTPALTLAGGWGAVSEPVDPQASGEAPDTRVGIRDRVAGGWGAVSEPIDPQSSSDEPDTKIGVRDCIAYGLNAAGYDSWAG